MKRLKIMQEDSVSSTDLFGMNDLQDRPLIFSKDLSPHNDSY